MINRSLRAACALAVSLVALAGAPTAHATIASVEDRGAGGRFVVVDAALDEVNDIKMSLETTSTLKITEFSPGATKQAGAGCRLVDATNPYMSCPLDVAGVIVRMANLDDAFEVDPFSESSLTITVYGGYGNDALWYGWRGRPTLDGGPGDDVLQTTKVGATMSGGDGADRLLGGPMADTLDGGLGPDVISGGGSYDTVTYAARSESVIVLQDGWDNDGSDVDGPGGDRDNVTSAERLIGGSGDDVLWLDQATTVTYPVPELHGNGGNDYLQGWDGGADRIHGGPGDDRLAAGGGMDRLYGEAGHDELNGGNDADMLDGGPGADTLIGGAGTDQVRYDSRSASEPLVITVDGIANDGTQILDARTGTTTGDNVSRDIEWIMAGAGNDRITGSAGDERLDGGLGDDTIIGGGGVDLLEGSLGADELVANDEPGDVDRVDCGGGVAADVARGDMHDRFIGCATIDAPIPPAPVVVERPVLSTTYDGFLSCTKGTWSNYPHEVVLQMSIVRGATNQAWGGQVQEEFGYASERFKTGPEHVGAEIRCSVRATNRGGVVRATSVDAVRAGRNGLPAPLAIGDGPTITGGARSGDLITCDPGPWSGSPQLRFEWITTDGQLLATGSTYSLTLVDHGRAMQCRVIDAGAAPHPVVYSRNVIVPDARPRAVSEPAIAGQPAIGASLGCIVGSWLDATAYDVAWFRVGAPDATMGTTVGAGRAHSVAVADAGSWLRCAVSGRNAHGVSTPVWSAAVAVPVPPQPVVDQVTGVGDAVDVAPTVPPADRMAPVIRLTLARHVRVHRAKPVLPLRFACPATEVRCRYRLTLTVRRGRRHVRIGVATALVARNQTRLSSLPLNATGRRLLRRTAMHATLRVVVTDASGNRRTLARAVTIRPR